MGALIAAIIAGAIVGSNSRRKISSELLSRSNYRGAIVAFIGLSQEQLSPEHMSYIQILKSSTHEDAYHEKNVGFDMGHRKMSGLLTLWN